MKTIVEYLLGNNKIPKDEFPKDYCLAFPVDKVFMYFNEHWPDAMVKDAIGARMFIMTKRDVEDYREISEYPKTYLKTYMIPEGYDTIDDLKAAYKSENMNIIRGRLKLLESLENIDEYLITKTTAKAKRSTTLIESFEQFVHKDEPNSIKELKLVYKKYDKQFSEYFEILCEILDTLASKNYVLAVDDWLEETYTDTYGYTHMYNKESKTIRMTAFDDFIVIQIINVAKLVTMTIEFDLTPRKNVQVHEANHGARNAKEFVGTCIKRGQLKWASLYDMNAGDPFENFRKSIEMTLEI